MDSLHRVDAHGDGSPDEESSRRRLLREWLELEDRYDHELARRFYDARGHAHPTSPQPSSLEAELPDLARAVRRAKAAYEEARNTTP